MDIASLRMVIDSRDVKRGKDDLDGLARQGDATERRIGRSTQRMSGSFASMTSFIKQAAAAMLAFKTAESFVRIADQASQVEARIKLVTEATESYAQVQQRLVAISNKNFQLLSATANLYAKLKPSMTAMNKSTEHTLQVVDAFGKALRVGGADVQAAASATLQFAQAMASGVLRGDEFNSIAEASPRILQAIADGSGYAAGELRALAADGVLSAKLVSDALQSQLGVLTAEAERIPQTVGGAFQVLQNNLMLTIDAINKSSGATEGMKAVIAGLSSAAEFAGGILISTFSAINTFVKTTDGAIGALKDTLVVAAGAAAGFAFAVNIGPVIGIATIALTGMVAQVQMATMGMTAAAVATRAMGAAMAFLAAHPAIIVFATIGASIAYVNRVYDKLIAKAEADAARSKQQQQTLKGLNDERERLAKIGKGVTEAQAQEIERRERTLQQLRDEGHSREAINSAMRVFDENAKRRRDIADASQAAEQKRIADAKAATEAEQQAKKVAQDRLHAAEQMQQKRTGYAQELADLQAIQRLVQGGMAMDEARTRVQMARQGALQGEIDALIEQQAAVDRLADADRLVLETLKEIGQEQAKQAEEAQRAIEAFLGKDYGANLAAGFDKASQSLGQFVNGFSKLISMQEDYNEARVAANGDVATLARLEAKNARDQIGAYANITGAAKGFFKEGSKGYKALQTAEQVFRLYQLAMNAKVVAAQVAGYFTSQTAHAATVAPTVAGEAVKATAMGTTAVAAQAAVPVAGPALAAAMIAFLAGIGILIGGGGKKGPGFTDNTGAGTVLGDSGAQSKSIANSIEALESAASLENRISSAMLASLRNIEANIGGLTNLIIRGGVGDELAAKAGAGFKTNAIGGLFTGIGDVLANIPLIGGLLGGFGKLLGGLFGTKTKITAQGLTAVPQALGEIMQNGFDLLEFVAIQTKKKAFGITTSTKNSIKTGLADPELARQFGLIFSDFRNAIVAAADPLGFSTEAIAKRLESFVVDIGKINLKGLKGDEIQEKLEAVFGAQADKMAEYAFPMLTEFQKVGEGLFETVVRVASGIEQADTLLQRLGLTAVNYTTLLNTQGDIVTEIIRQSVLLTDSTKGIAGGFAEIVANFQGTGEEITDLVMQLRDLQNALTAAGQQSKFLTTFMIAGAGGADRLTSGLESYFDDYLTAQERAEELTRRVTGAFNNLGLILPTSVDGFRALVEGVDISTEAGQRLYGALIANAPAFKDMTDAIADAGQEAGSFEAVIRDAFKELRDAVKQAESDLQAAFQRESAMLRDTIKTFGDLGKTLRDFAMSLAGIVEAPAASLVRLRAEYSALVTRGKLGDATAAAGIPTAGKALADAAIANSGSAIDAAREIAKIRADALAVAAVADRQKSIAEQQLDALNEQVGGLIQLENATLSVRDAVDNLRTLQSFENKAISDATTSGLGVLITQNGQTKSAIEKGTAATNAINSGIASLVSLQAKQEADRQAALAAQQAEVQRTNAIKQIEVQAAQFKNAVLSGTAMRAESTTDLATLTQKAIDLANRSEVALNANVGPRSAVNDAVFGVNEAGLFEQKFGQVTALGKNKSNMAKRLNAFNTEFYKPGGLFDQINAEAAALSAAKALIDPAQAQLATLRNQVIALGGIPAFATGGMHSGGLRLVGENGPELEYTGPSRIFNAGQTSSMLDNSDQIAELRALRDEMKGYLWSISKSTLRTADRLDRWDDGDRMNVRIDNESDDPALVRTVA